MSSYADAKRLLFSGLFTAASLYCRRASSYCPMCPRHVMRRDTAAGHDSLVIGIISRTLFRCSAASAHCSPAISLMASLSIISEYSACSSSSLGFMAYSSRSSLCISRSLPMRFSRAYCFISSLAERPSNFMPSLRYMRASS